jgi:hypothetical protein
MKYIRYTAGYKYQLEEIFFLATNIKPLVTGGNRYVRLDTDGLLIVREGYAWDGASGPAIDTPSLMRGSLVHDALYQLIRLGVLDEDKRKPADRLLYQMVIEDGMPDWMAIAVYRAVRTFGGVYMRAHDARILTAP